MAGIRKWFWLIVADFSNLMLEDRLENLANSVNQNALAPICNLQRDGFVFGSTDTDVIALCSSRFTFNGKISRTFSDKRAQS